MRQIPRRSVTRRGAIYCLHSNYHVACTKTASGEHCRRWDYYYYYWAVLWLVATATPPLSSASVVGPIGLRTGTSFSFACAADELLGLVETRYYFRLQTLMMICQNELTGVDGKSVALQGSGHSSVFKANMHENKGAVAMIGTYDKDSMCGIQFQYVTQAVMPTITTPTYACILSATGATNTLRCPSGEKISGLFGNWQGGDATYRLGLVCRPAQCRGNEVDSTFCSCLAAGTYQSGVSCLQCANRLSVCNPAFQYLAGCGGTNAGTCTDCNPLPVGYGFTGAVGQSSDCPNVKCPGWMASPGGTSTAVCYPCPVNANPSSDGGVCQCVAGYYMSGGACVVCPAGTWGAVAGITGACPNLCPASTWGTATGQTTQANACSGQCSAGYYGTTTGATSVAAACSLLRCTINNYWDGSQCASCQKYATANCVAGQYLNGCGIASTGTCTKCNANVDGVKFREEVGLTAECAGWFCMAGTYVPAGGYATNCYNCPANAWSVQAGSGCYCGAGYYSVTGSCTTTACLGTCAVAPCPLGSASSGVCQGCSMGTYGNLEGKTSQSTACPNACPAGTYGLMVGGASQASACGSCLVAETTRCLVGQYLAECVASGAGTCRPCANGAAGKFMTGRGGLTSTCPLATCSPGTYSSGGAVTVCITCSVNMQSAGDLGSCQCVPGTYSDSGVCKPCPAGSWGTVPAAVSLASGCGMLCPAGTYGTGTGKTSAVTACTAQCPPGTWGSKPGASSASDGCYGNSPKGTWGTVSGATSDVASGNNLCPAGTYGTVEGATSQATGCNNLCPAGTWGVDKGKSTLVEACGDNKCPFGTYGNVLGQASRALACPGACAVGTYAIATGQTSEASACSNCTACIPGATIITPCTNTAQIKCGAYVADTYSNPGFPGISNPLFYVQGVSPPLLGVIPLSITVQAVPSFTRFVMPTYTTNAMGVSTAMAIADPNSYRVTIRFLAACQALGPDRVYKPWNPVPIGLVCLSDPMACLNIPVVCGLALATRCVGLVGAGGYYTGSDGISCVACTTSAPQSPCGWGEYGNISACTASGDSKCAPCYGTKPANSVWTKSVVPHYYVGAPTCAWACDVGFYLDSSGTQCVACYLPEGGVFKGGDIIGGGEVVLTTTPVRVSKYFGGSLVAGCGIICSPGTNLGYPSIGAGYTFSSADVRCNPCFVPTCTLGEEIVFANGQNCQACSPCAAVANARFLSIGSCAFACNAGFVKLGGVCQSCSSSACADGQYRTRCTELVDSVCATCAPACAPGSYTVSACNASADRVCDTCPSVFLDNGVVGPECVATCKLGWAYSGSSCLKCIQGCKADQEFLPVCEMPYLGCRPCPLPTSYTGPWCWTGNAIVSCQTKAINLHDTTGCRIIPAQFITTIVRTASGFVTSARLALPSTTAAVASSVYVFPSSSGNARTLGLANYNTSTGSSATTLFRETSAVWRSTSSIPTRNRSGSPTATSTVAYATVAPVSSSSSSSKAALMAPPPPEMVSLSLLSCGVVSASSGPPWCLVPQWNRSIRSVFGPGAVVVGLQNSTDAFFDCPNFVCPSCVGQRRLLSDAINATLAWRIVFQWYQTGNGLDPAPYFVNLTILDPTILGSDTFIVLAQRIVARGTEGVWIAIKEWIAQDAAASSSLVPVIVGVAVGLGALLAMSITLVLY